MTTPHISNYPRRADVTFKDGTTRRVDHTLCTTYGCFVVFVIQDNGDEVYINVDTIQTIDMIKAAEMAGRA